MKKNVYRNRKRITKGLYAIESGKRMSSRAINSLSNEPHLLDVYLKSSIENTFSELLFRLTSEKYNEKKANLLWRAIIIHKRRLRKELHRDVGILVATLDYLTNIVDEISSPKITRDTQIETAARMATTDPLTGLYSRNVFDVFLEKEIIKSVRYRKALSLAMIDIDGFKQINDAFGHQAGDRVLVDLVRIVSGCIRKADLFARYGGEEFVVIMPETHSGEAFLSAERIRKSIDRFLRVKDRPVTVSIGIGTLSKKIKSAYDLVKRADEALYKAKSKGKNRVVLC